MAQPTTKTSESADKAHGRLIQHANDVRKHANLDTLDAFLGQSGYSWIEMMISHAKDSFESYQSSAHDADSTMAHAFEHRMAAEMLKTPSPKKKRAPANSRILAIRPQATAASSSADLLTDDKENRLPIPSAPSATPAAAPVARSHAREVSSEKTKRDSEKETFVDPYVTRSRGDKSQLMELPGPFQEYINRKSDPTKKTKTKSTRKETKKQTRKAAKGQATKNASSKDRSREEKEKKSEESAHPEEQSVTHAAALPTATSDDADHDEMEAVGDESEAGLVSAVDVAKQPITFESPSPRESTPPPQSPTKEQRAEMSVRARAKLDETLLKLASDDEQDEDGSDAEDSLAELARREKQVVHREARSSPPTTGHSDSKEEQAPAEELKEARLSAQESVESSLESVLQEGAKVQLAAPKRTLSSMTHAKKSMVGSSSITSKQQLSRERSRGSSIAPSMPIATISTATASTAGTTTQATKSSFLSKSIMRVEQEQRSIEHVVEEHRSEDSASRKRKSDELSVKGSTDDVVADSRLAKVARKEGHESPNNAKSAPVARGEKDAPSAAQPQSLREKIESYNTHKSTAPPTASASSRNFSSMSTHSVGLGTTKISSPIFARSESQKTLNSIGEPASPTPDAGNASTKAISTKPSAKEKTSSRAAEKQPTESVPNLSLPQSTTPLNSPTKPALQDVQGARLSTAIAFSSSPSEPPMRSNDAHDSLDSLDAGSYDTSSDGDLSLVGMMGDTRLNPTVKTNASAPRPPGTSLRPMTTMPKQTSSVPAAAPTTSVSSKGSTFMPSSTVNKDGQPASRLGRGPDQQGSSASTASASSGTSSAATSSAGNHGTWGGSISSKLKGMLGFSNSISGATSGSQGGPSSTMSRPLFSTSPSKSKPVAIPARKESFISSSNGSSTTRQAAVLEKKPASVLRIEAVRKREAEAAERRAKEKEERVKAAQEASKKRLREDKEAAVVTSTAAASSTKIKPASVGPSAGRALTHQQSQQRLNATSAVPLPSDAKKRKSNEGTAVSAKAGASSAVASAKPASLQSHKSHNAASSSQQSKPASSSVSKAQSKTVDRGAPAGNIFTDTNPFQRAQQQQQHQSLAAVSQQVQQHKTSKPVASATSKLSPASKAQAVANTAHIELEEPDSAYSDSEDEETIRKRKQHKPWETREGLALALEAQANIDADMIFGIPQGAVPLDDILPPESEHARVRRMRPRSSSATWSRDGLKQFEVDRYNERMGIAASGVQLIGTTRDDGSGTPSRPSSRMSALALSAIAQGQVSNKKGANGANFR